MLSPIYIKFDEIKEMMSDHNSSDLAPQRQEMSVENVSSGLVPQGQKASNYDNSDPVPPRQNVVPTAEKTDSSQQGLEFLFSPLLEEYYNPTHDQAEENNNDQAPNASFQKLKFVIFFVQVLALVRGLNAYLSDFEKNRAWHSSWRFDRKGTRSFFFFKVNSELLNSELLNSELLNSELLNSELLNSELPNSELLKSLAVCLSKGKQWLDYFI
ncbi:hypothetical protein Tco_0947867 [Tanacetum coccineum]